MVLSTISPNQTPIFGIRPGILGAIKLDGDEIMQPDLSGVAGGAPVIVYDSDLRGNKGAIVEAISVFPLGTNVASVLHFFFRDSNINPTEWWPAFQVALPASSVPTAAAITGYPVAPTLFPLLSPIADASGNQFTGLRISPDQVQWACSLGTAVASGYIVKLFGMEYQ